MVQVMMEMPDVPKGKKYTGEMRQVNKGEQHIRFDGKVDIWGSSIPSTALYPVIVDVYPRPDWMLPGWLVNDGYGWLWCEQKPRFLDRTKGWHVNGRTLRVSAITDLTNLTFTPPFYTGGYEHSLTEV